MFHSEKLDDEEDPDSRRILRHIELIDDEATEYGITIVKTTDKLMAKKYGYRKLPGLTYFRKGAWHWMVNTWMDYWQSDF